MNSTADSLSDQFANYAAVSVDEQFMQQQLFDEHYMKGTAVSFGEQFMNIEHANKEFKNSESVLWCLGKTRNSFWL